ncbi:hypothetical protein AB0C02_28740 [Micromonospora sp. NPDC048999]|uniref:hypothetical protein n=1 Tax=Micromonospora sp. NPDC048999 TaxID=3155391 RepID=UPI003410015A
MQEGRWTTITPSQFSHEREALAHVQALLPDTEPYRAWSNFTFTAQTGHPMRSICWWRDRAGST